MNLYIKIFATFLLPITLGFLFTLFSINSLLEHQKKLIHQNKTLEINNIQNRFDNLVQNIQRDITIISRSQDIITALENQDNATLSTRAKAFLGSFYSTVIFLDNKDFVLSRATNEFKFGDKLSQHIMSKISINNTFKGIVTIDDKELLLFSKKLKNYSNKDIGYILLGITLNENFLKNIIYHTDVALQYQTLEDNIISSKEIKHIQTQLPFNTNITSIDKEKRFTVILGINKDIEDLKEFKTNILTFTVIVCIVVIFLLYFVLTNFLHPYKKIYNLLLDFARNKVDFKYIKNASRNIANQTKTKEIYFMAKAINKVAKKALRNEENLRNISYTDQLTKVFNRRRLDEILVRESYEANRYNKKLSVIIMDLDYFKNINDTYGHQTGDKILKQFSALINDNLRISDHFGRWGGEEFMLICSNTDAEGAKQLASKIQDMMKSYKFAHNIKLTASFGIGEIAENENVHNLLIRTDEALYKAKNAGRDTIETADNNIHPTDESNN